MSYIPLDSMMLIEGHVLTWEGQDSPVTVIDRTDSKVTVETSKGERMELYSVENGLAQEGDQQSLSNVRVIGTKPWRVTKQLTKHFDKTMENYGSKTISAIEYGERAGLDIDEVNRRFSALQGDTRSSYNVIREGYDTWIVYDTNCIGTPSKDELLEAFRQHSLVTDVEEEETDLIITFAEQTEVVPPLVVDLIYRSKFGIKNVREPPSTSHLSIVITTQLPESNAGSGRSDQDDAV